MNTHGIHISFGTDDHYTVPALEALETELASKTASKLANMTADEIQATANHGSFESARQYTRALGPQ